MTLTNIPNDVVLETLPDTAIEKIVEIRLIGYETVGITPYCRDLNATHSIFHGIEGRYELSILKNSEGNFSVVVTERHVGTAIHKNMARAIVVAWLNCQRANDIKAAIERKAAEKATGNDT